MAIGTSISSLTIQRHLTASKNDMENAMERLASGNRINSSRDDAAGMAIAGRMKSQISGLNQSIRNANDGIALAQSAEGALDETTSILQRMRDLSVQASSATLTTSDRSSVQAEVTALTAELDRISSTTKFNNISLLAGTATGLQFQVGAGAGENVSLTIGSASSSDLGLAGTNTGNTGALAGGRMATLNGLNGNDVQINGVDWIENNNAAVTATVTVNNANGVSTNAKTSTAAGVALIINSGTASHGATATASNLVKGTVASGVTDGAITINGEAIAVSANIAEFVANINHAAPNANARLNAAGNGVELFNTTGETITIVGNTDALENTGLTASVSIGFLDLTNSDGTKTLITKGDNLGAKVTDVNAMGFNTRSSASSITGSSISSSTDLALTDDLTINGIAVGPSTNNGQPSASNVAAQLNTYSAQTNVLASANTKVTLAIDTTMAAGVATSTNVGATEEMTINGVQIIFTTATQTMAQMVTKVNDKLSAAGQGGITATADGSNLILESVGGQTITITDTDQGATLFTRADGSTVNATATLTDFTGQITLTNTAGGDVTFGTVTGTEAELDTTLALLGMHQQGSTTGSTSTTGLSMASTAAASAAITAIDAAIEKVFVSRGALGAFQNRLDHTVSNLRNVSENMSFSKSQIMDTDFATESANLAKAQVLQQAGTAMLAQANASGQSVLSLLK
jgi:flagellin